jgi:hypothetical protein
MWWTCLKRNWPDCPFPIDVISPDDDIGWNENLIRYLRTQATTFVLLLLDDHWIDGGIPSLELTANMERVLEIMRARPEIASVKVQAGNAASPDVEFESWTRLGVYDRRDHPFKRVNLVPTIFRREWLRRLSNDIRFLMSENRRWKDKGRLGALAFERVGTYLTMDSEKWPELMLGINRESHDPACAASLLKSYGNDALREGRLQQHVEAEVLRDGISLDALGAFALF